MTAVPRPDVATHQHAPTAALRGTNLASGSVADVAGGDTAKLQQAARDFETVFLRQMLSALERTTKVGDKGPNIAGQQAYGSMIVEAVADAVAQAGGIGLGSVLAKALAEKSTAQGPSSRAVESGVVRDSAIKGSRRSEGAAPFDSSVNFRRISSQGLDPDAVPKTEIRTSPAHMTGQLADRRIR